MLVLCTDFTPYYLKALSRPFSLWTIFFFVACIGWCASVVLHVFSIFGISPGPSALMLGLGIFAVWLPFIIRVKTENPTSEESGWSGMRSQRVNINQIFKHAPKWMRVVAIAGFVYAFISFFLVMYMNTPKHEGITALDVRGFSGHFIAFFGVAAAGLYPKRAESGSTSA